MVDEAEIGYEHGTLYLEEIKRCMLDKGLLSLLDYDMGIFSAKGQFINHYLNYIHRAEGRLLINNKMRATEGLNFKEILYLLKKMAQDKEARPVDVLFISRNRKVKAKTIDGYVEGDYIFYSIMDQLSRIHPQIKFDLFIIDDVYKGYYYSTPYDIIFALYLSLKKCLQWRYLRKGIIKRLEEINCENVAETACHFFQYKPLMRSLLIGYSMKRVLEMYRPKVIVINDDCITTKPTVFPQIKFIVMQSARMAEHLEVCRKISFEDKGTKPDYFLASGEVFGEMKRRCGAADEVIVTGLPRYDVLGDAQKIYSRHDFLKRYNIDPDKKIILWLTQSHGLSDEENEKTLAAVFSSMEGLKDVVLIIKQHPAEPPEYAGAIKEHMHRHEINAVLAPNNADTIELLFNCHLMITKNSTTAMEAVALGRPVISLNLSGQPLSAEYVREGVALGITDGSLLKDAIGQLLKDDHELAANRQKYIEKYLYRVDGRATQRVIKIILKCLSKDN